MPFEFIRYRIGHHWHKLALLLIVMSVTSAFLVLQNLYTNALAEGYLQLELRDSTPTDFQVALRSLDTPIDSSLLTSLEQNIGNRLVTTSQSVRTRGTMCPLGVTESDNCHLIIAFENPEALLDIVDGAFPVPLDSSDDPEAPAFEAIINTDIADTLNLSVGDVIVYSERNASEVRFRISGIAQPLNPQQALWQFEVTYLTGARIPFGSGFRIDYGIIVLPEVYDALIMPIIANDAIESFYTWRAETDQTRLTVSQLRQQVAGLRQVEQDFFQLHPQGDITGTLIPLFTTLSDDIAITEAPVFIIAITIFIVMLLQLLYLSMRLIDSEQTEWNILVERGATLSQLFRTQFMTMSVIALLSVLLAPIIGWGALRLFDSIGLISGTLDNAQLSNNIVSLPVLIFSVLATLIAWVVITAYLWIKYREREDDDNHPARNPFFLRYYLDIVLIVIGVLFLLRLYVLTSGSLTDSLQTLFEDPGTLMDELARQADERSLVDPFNLIGPMILIMGVMITTTRFIPLIVRLIAWIGKFINNLILPLPLWTSGRGLAQYGTSLVLLMTILTFFGSGYALHATQDNAAWEQARLQNADYVNITLSDGTAVDEQNWLDLPNVTAQTALLTESGTIIFNDMTDLNNPVDLLGINPAELSDNFPEFAPMTTTIESLEPPESAGLTLAPTANALSLQLYSSGQGTDEPTRITLSITLRDAKDIPVEIMLETDDEFNVGSFILYSATIPEPLHAPYRLMGLTIESERGDATEFEHRVFIDNISISTGNETVIIGDFETSNMSIWQQNNDRQFVNRNVPRPVIVRNRNIVFEGEGSLQIDYEVIEIGSRLSTVDIQVNDIAPEPVPIFISTALAEYMGSTTSAREPLIANDRGELSLQLGARTIDFDFTVLGVIDAFTGQGEDHRYIITDVTRLLPYLNRDARPEAFFDRNQIWLQLTDRNPDDLLRTTLTERDGIESVTFAWDEYRILTQSPLTNAISGIFYIGFWFALVVYGVIVIVDIRNRSTQENQDYRVLTTLGWSPTQLQSWLMLKRIIPTALALVAGLGSGVALAYLLLPFLRLVSHDALSVPFAQYLLLGVGILVLFTVILYVFIRTIPINNPPTYRD